MRKEDEKFLTEVFAQLTDEATEDGKRRELVSQTELILPARCDTIFECFKCGNLKVGWYYCNIDIQCCGNVLSIPALVHSNSLCCLQCYYFGTG